MALDKLFYLVLVGIFSANALAVRADQPKDKPAIQATMGSEPAFVDVADTDRRSPVHYRVPRKNFPSLVDQKIIVALDDPLQTLRYRFASAEASARWFAAARPVVPYSDSTRGPLQELNFGRSAPWLTIDLVLDHARRPWFWSDDFKSDKDFKEQVEEIAADKRQFLQSCKLLLIDRSHRAWMLPRHGSALFGYDMQQRQWIEHDDLPGEKPPKHIRNKELAPHITGPAYESRSGLLIFGDQLGVHVFDGHTWQFQKLYQRNIDENRFWDSSNRPRGTALAANSEERRFRRPSFCEDSSGRVYAWTRWGWELDGNGGGTGTIGFWVYDHGTWKNVDVVERVMALIPREPDELWIVSDPVEPTDNIIRNPLGKLSVVKAGRHITGEEAQQLLMPNLRFRGVWPIATSEDGTAFLLLRDVHEQDSIASIEFRGAALRPAGPAVDLGNAAGTFLSQALESRAIVDPRGWVWGDTNDGLTAMSPDGQLQCYPVTARLNPHSLIGADERYVYFTSGRSLWRFDWTARGKTSDSDPFLPATVVRIRGCAAQDEMDRMWCVWDIPLAPPVVYGGTNWEPRLDAEIRERPEYLSMAYRGAGGAMIFADDSFRLHLFDSMGHVMAGSAEQLAMKYGDRLRKALPYPPRERIVGRPDFQLYDYLAKDVKERVWWTVGATFGRKPCWGVVDGNTALHGDMADLARRVPDGQFESLCPIGEGTGMLLKFQTPLRAAESGIYTVQNDRIVRLADAPGDSAASASDGPPARADNSGRVWVTRDDASQSIDRQGNAGHTHQGWFAWEDRKKGIWFRTINRIGLGLDRIMRLAADGRQAALELPHLANATSLAEAPDGSIWTLTTTELIRIHADGNHLTIVEHYPIAVTAGDRLWCDRNGRVWMQHTTISRETPEQTKVYTDLIRFATVP